MVKLTHIDRRTFCGALFLGGLISSSPILAAALRTVTDMAGRKVKLSGVPKRIVLLEAKDIVSMALVHPEPVSLVLGWAAVDRIDSRVLQRSFENDRRIEVVGKQTPDTISIEGLISLSPDLVVATSFMAPLLGDDLLVERLERAGIPVIFSDLSSNTTTDKTATTDTIVDMRRQLTMWGEILEAGERASAFLSFFDEHLDSVSRRLKGAPPVTTYLEVQSTLDDCCWAAGTKIWGELLEIAGGKTLPSVTAPWFQKLQLEYLLSTPNDVYIASGGGWDAGGRPAIGPGLDLAKGREGLRRLTERIGFNQIPSVRNGRVHGIWTGLISMSPLNIVFIELVAKWLHPEQCADLDAAATLAEINRQFLSIPIDGPLWVSLQE